jgi:hypothetical protein
MNKIIAAIVGLVLIATPAFAKIPSANSEVSTILSATGQTTFNEFATVWGYDYSETGTVHEHWQMTAYTQNLITNDKSLTIQKEVESPGQWEMQEEMLVGGEGNTFIGAAVGWWTEDSHTTGSPLSMKWPTVANIYTGFFTQTFTDEEQINSIADSTTPAPGHPGAFSDNYFLKNIDTNSDFSFVEGVGINLPSECTPELPSPWYPPTCDGCAP